MCYSDRVHFNFPISAARVHDADPAGQRPLPTETSAGEAEAIEEKNASILRGEDGGAESIPSGAMAALGVAPMMSSASTIPVPSNLGTEIKPDANHNAAWGTRATFLRIPESEARACTHFMVRESARTSAS
jgi:hypothetical protein